MSKRKNGEGSWGKKKIGKYTYNYYRDINGNYTYGKTIKEVNQKLTQKKEQEFVLNNKTTFGEYINNWLLQKKSTIEPTTYDCYETMIDSQIINFKDYDLANQQLSNLSRETFQKYLDALAEKYSRATIKKIWVIIKQCISYGEINNDVPINTTKLVKVPIEANVKVKKKEVPFLTKNDADKLYNIVSLTYSNGEPVYGSNARALILIMYSGMRVSEMIALKWKNVDIKNKRISIEQSAAEIKNRSNDGGNAYIQYDKSPKTHDSERIIPLPNRAMEMIEWFENKNKNHTPDDYVCLSNHQPKINRPDINRTLQSIDKHAECSITDLSVHSLRHTYGSILLSEGVDIKKVSELLGHSDITVTYNIYIGILENEKKDEVERVFN